MKSLGFAQEITVRLTFEPDVNLVEAEKALFEKAYHKKSALQLAFDICSTWRLDVSKWLNKHITSVRADEFSNTLIVTMETYALSASDFVGFVMDILTVLVDPIREIGPLPEEYLLKRADIYVIAKQPEWFASVVGEEAEGQFEASLYPAEKVKLLEFPWEQDS